MFRFLMEEEERHREAIVNQMQRLAEGKGMKFERSASAKKALAKFKSPLLTDDLVKEGRQVEGEVAALSIGMTLEKRAIAQFTALRKTVAGDARAEKVFSDLVAWEQDHLDVLTRQYDQMREMYWEEARFLALPGPGGRRPVPHGHSEGDVDARRPPGSGKGSHRRRYPRWARS